MLKYQVQKTITTAELQPIITTAEPEYVDEQADADGTAEPVSRDQNLRHARGQGNIHFPCSADHEQDWQPYLVHPYSATRYV